MARVRHPVAWLAVVFALGLAAPGQAQRIRLSYVAEGNKPKYTPLDQKLLPVEQQIELPVGGREAIAVKPEAQSKLKIDTTGDGRLDRSVGPGDVFALRLKIGGQLRPYQLRYQLDPYKRRCITAACAWTGVVAGVQLAILDSNCNGKFNDYGEDTMVLGQVPYGYPLSKTIVVGKQAFTIEVAESGESVEVKPAGEKLERIDFVSQFNGEKKPLMVVFKRDRGWSADHVALYPAGETWLPVDEWAFAYAVFTDKLWARSGDDPPPIELKKGAALLRWGKPYHLEVKAKVASEGTSRTVTQPGAWQAPQLIEKKVPGRHIALEIPAIVGRGGERYVGNWRYADNWGVALADPNIDRFVVRITLGGTVVNAPQAIWKRLDMSGLVRKTRPFWVPYEWKSGPLKGKLSIEVRGSSSRFGALSLKKPVEVELD